MTAQCITKEVVLLVNDRYVYYDGRTVTEEECVKEYDAMIWDILNHSSYRELQFGAFDVEDMLQHCRIVLIKAARRYEPVHNTKFSTYAYQSILLALRTFLRDYSYPVKLNHYAKTVFTPVRNMMRDHGIRETERLAPFLARKHNVPIAAIYEAMRYVNTGSRILSIHASSQEEGMFSSLVEYVADPTVEDQFEAMTTRFVVEDFLDTLHEDERDVVISYARGYSYKDVGDRLGKSRQTARNVHMRALKKLQRDATYY